MDMLENNHTPEGLSELLADDAVMLSPVVHTPQKGKMLTMAYLLAAGETIGNDTFKYTKIFDCGNRAVLEFETEMDGIHVNGVDIIQWNESGQITEFKVMVRPLKAIQSAESHSNGARKNGRDAGKDEGRSQLVNINCGRYLSALYAWYRSLICDLSTSPWTQAA